MYLLKENYYYEGIYGLIDINYNLNYLNCNLCLLNYRCFYNNDFFLIDVYFYYIIVG